MKRIISLIIILIITIGLMSCCNNINQSNDLNEIIDNIEENENITKADVVKSFINIVYNVNYNTDCDKILEKVKPYVEEYYYNNDFSINSLHTEVISFINSFENNGEVIVKEITLDERDNDVVYFKMAITLILDNEIYELKPYGVMRLVMDNGNWKIKVFEPTSNLVKLYEILKNDKYLEKEEKVEYDEMGYYVFVDKKEAKEVLKYNKVSIPSTINDLSVWCFELIDKSKVLVCLTDENNSDYEEYGVYDFVNGIYKTCLVDKGNEVYGIEYVDKDYIVFRVADDNWWMKTSLYYYSMDLGEIKKIFDHTKDEAGNDVYRNFNNVVIKDNKIWFDDFYLDKNNDICVDTLSYDLITEEINLVKKNSQNPMIYKDNAITFVKNENNEFKRIENIFGNKKVLDVKEHIKTIDSSNNEIYCIENKRTDDVKHITEFQVKDIINDFPIFYTERYIERVRVSDYFVSWFNYNENYPSIYSINNKCMLIFSEFDKCMSSCYIKDNYGLLSVFSYENKDKNEFYFFIEE